MPFTFARTYVLSQQNSCCKASGKDPVSLYSPAKLKASQTRSLEVQHSSEGVQHIWLPPQLGEHGTNPGSRRPSRSTLLLSAACRAICSVCRQPQPRAGPAPLSAAPQCGSTGQGLHVRHFSHPVFFGLERHRMDSEGSGYVFQSVLLEFHTSSELGVLRFFHWEKQNHFISK